MHEAKFAHLFQEAVSTFEPDQKRRCRADIIPLALCALLLSWNKASAGDQNTRGQTSVNYSSTPASFATNHLWLTPPRAARFSLGFETYSHWQAPISGLRGTLYRLGNLRLDFGISANVVFQIYGPLRQMLDIDSAASTPVPGMPTSGTTSDAGDFSVATILRLWENRRKDFAFGLQVETRLPNSTQRKGIGTNTTDIFLAVLASKKWHTGILFGELGMGILTAPLETDVQNDVLLYGMGAAWKARPRVQFFGEINGYLTTRNIIPAGTEARGMARAGLAWQFNSWSVEACAQHGLTDNEGEWGVRANLVRGISW